MQIPIKNTNPFGLQHHFLLEHSSLSTQVSEHVTAVTCIYLLDPWLYLQKLDKWYSRVQVRCPNCRIRGVIVG